MAATRTKCLICILLACIASIASAFRISTRKSSTISNRSLRMEIFEGNPVGKAIWNTVWKLPLLQPGKQGESPTNFGDAALVLRNNILQIYGDEPSYDGAPVAEGDVTGFLDGSAYLGLQFYYKKYGSVYKLLFGPKSFIVISDPHIVKFMLKDGSKYYDKGVLAEILDPIMGKGLIPADPETWKVRRRAIVPGFHKAWYNIMCKTFVDCNGPLLQKLKNAAADGSILDMETEFCSVSLDIIGRAVFNYDFGSVTKESPVIKAVYSTLKEAEHRSATPFPYWNLPFANWVVPRLRKFNGDLKILNDILDELIIGALKTRNEENVEDLEKRDYTKMENPSLLRFLVDMRGEDTTSKQLRDDLMTMLVAGHETTAAVLTWALFELSQQPALVSKLRQEIDDALGKRDPTIEDIAKLPLVRMTLAESLRMYPEPPLLIRRALEDHELPVGTNGFVTKVMRGTDFFIAVYNIHRSPDYWENPDTFDPERFTRPHSNPAISTWAGYTPNPNSMYPNEVHADFAYLPFGGGARKCVGDQFAYMEATITLAMILRDYDFALATKPEDVGTYTGATIHTRNGLKMKVFARPDNKQQMHSKDIASVDSKQQIASTV